MSKLYSTIHKRVTELKGTYSIFIESPRDTIAMDENRVVPAASVIKLGIMIEAYRLIDEGQLNENDRITVRPSERVGGMGVLQHLHSVESLSIGDLMTLMITQSDNTASNCLINMLGKDQINHTIKRLGCTNTKLRRSFMDVESAKRGVDNTTCARDMVAMLKALSNTSEILTSESSKKAIHTMKQQQLRGKLPYRIEGKSSFTLAHKTGELQGVEHDVGIMNVRGEDVYIAVLLDQLPNNRLGKEAIGYIGEAIYRSLNE
ncbi:serine hydrolase [Alteribacter aurantiacus]|uniref:serine hydrolase n=1 Tax=Alteribacter aurantiacus TaxID=254410 RepID=UPI0003F9AEBC|nr:serine hydrolase [Alteribacter aurantiacus]